MWKEWKLMGKFLSSQNKKFYLVLVASVIFNIILILVSMSVGRYKVDIKNILFFKNLTSIDRAVLMDVRLPRIIAAILFGATLSQTGAVYQGMFNNPLVSSYILGVSSGAGFGAALGILLSSNILLIEVLAFIFGIIAVILTLTISRAKSESISLVLSGFVVGSLFQSFISFLKYVADPYTKLPSIVFWLMGSLSQITLKDIVIVAPILVLLLVVVALFGWKLNILSFGDEEAISLGENPRLLKRVLIFITTLQSALVVSFAGVIGWVGLIIPHTVRFLVGYDNSKVLVLSIFFGSGFLLLIDTLSRTIFPVELPIGILTSIIGAPFFFVLIRRRHN